MLSIKNLHAGVNGKTILNGLNLTINPGELHAIMGRNGSGKSTLANIITGRDNYEIFSGEVEFNNKNIHEMSPDERALEGIFMSFQYPVVIPGVNNTYFLRAALNAQLKHNGQDEVNAADFMRLIREKLKLVNMDEKYLSRAVNDGFSGGEKKRNEMLQMLMIKPKLCILDETDSGLDVDSLKVISRSIQSMRESRRSFIVITHYHRILEHLDADYVHILSKGKIVKTGSKELAIEIENKGFKEVLSS